jgi:archaellum biogenesis protein FlaJ (TadC family)
MKIALLRAKRGMIGTGFLWLVMTMHAVLTSLLVFIYEILITFTNLLQTMSPELQDGTAVSTIPNLLTFSSSAGELDLLHLMVIVIILVLALSNAWATFALNGGHSYCFAFYLALTAYISGIALLIVPPLVHMLFSGIV